MGSEPPAEEWEQTFGADLLPHLSAWLGQVLSDHDGHFATGRTVTGKPSSPRRATPA